MLVPNGDWHTVSVLIVKSASHVGWMQCRVAGAVMEAVGTVVGIRVEASVAELVRPAQSVAVNVTVAVAAHWPVIYTQRKRCG